MLGGTGEAGEPTHQRVVAGVCGSGVPRGEQRIETVLRMLDGDVGHGEADPPQPRGRHRGQQRLLGLAPGAEIRDPASDEVRPRQIRLGLARVHAGWDGTRGESWFCRHLVGETRSVGTSIGVWSCV